MSQVSHVIEVILFRSRFLLAPLYLGLVGTLFLLTYRFIVEFIHMFEKVGESSAQTFTLDLLAIGSLVAISVIELLKDFINLAGKEEVGEGTVWRILIHLTFVVSGVLFALMDWIADKREFSGTHK